MHALWSLQCACYFPAPDESVLGDLVPSICLVYLDDIIVFSRTFEEHLERLRLVLNRLRDAHLKVKPSKCSLVKSSVGYLGHVFSADGVRPDLAKINAVATWKQPTSITGVRQFLGFASYYRRFIQDFAKIATPLHALTKKHSTFSWPPAAQTAFDQLRQHLISAPVLVYPDASKPFILDTDASDHAIGGVLSQIDPDGAEHPIAYASKTLSSGQRNYTTTKRELLAVVEFTHYFRHYLLGAKFLLRTDHKALLWLSSFKNPDGIVARWVERLSAFDYDVQHRPGSQHTNADGLSRICACVLSSSRKCMRVPPPAAMRTCGVSLSTGPPTVVSPPMSATVQSPSWLPNNNNNNSVLRDDQRADPTIAKVITWVTAKERPAKGSPELATASPDLHHLWSQFDRLLYRRYESSDGATSNVQLLVPASQRLTVMEALHNAVCSDHLGISRTVDRARHRFYWPHMTSDIERWIRACPDCQKRKGPHRKPKAPMHSQPSSYPNQRIAIDIMGPLPITDRGNRYVLVIMDYFSKWVEIFPMPNMLASTVARLLFDGWICRYGAPAALHSDQGPQFESNLFKDLCRMMDVTKTRTTAYHPQSDGMVERFNRTLEAMIATSISDHRDWDLHLQHTALAYRTSVHASTGYTPFLIQFGHEAVLPLDLVYGRPRDTPPSSYHEYVQSRHTITTNAFTRARQHGITAHRLQKKQYDGTSRPSPRFQKSDLVLLHSPVVPTHSSPKFHKFWTGPYIITSVIDEVTVRIRKQDTASRTAIVVHVNRLKPYVQLRAPPPYPISYDADVPPPAAPPPPIAQAHPYNLRNRLHIQPPNRY